MNFSIKHLKIIALAIVSFFLSNNIFSQNGIIIENGSGQTDFLNAAKAVWNEAAKDYRGTAENFDTEMFPRFGEYSVYWAVSGENKGNFVLPHQLTEQYNEISHSEYSNYNLAVAKHLKLNTGAGKIAVFRSKINAYNNSINWEAIYFKALFEDYLSNNAHTFIDEDDLLSEGVPDDCNLLIIPDFATKWNNSKFYIDSLFQAYPNVGDAVTTFVANGGNIYAEGNAAYFIEKIGLLSQGAVDLENVVEVGENGLSDLIITNTDSPLSFAATVNTNQIFNSTIPNVTIANENVIAKLSSDNRPVMFELKNNGRVICNLALPTVGGIIGMKENSRQLQWTLNTIFYGLSHEIDVFHAVRNQLADGILAGENAVSFNRTDTFDVVVTIRNLSDEAINTISLKEEITPYFSFFGTKTANVSYTIENGLLTFNNLSVAANSEFQLIYQLITPSPDDVIHEQVDNFIIDDYFINAVKSTVIYTYNGNVKTYKRAGSYADIMFSANIVADTDVNWKNFLGLDYQPFKVSMIMENKERTSAESTRYEQYIPKDVPFYWSDKSLNIPILKTPGGEYVDVLRGSNDENAPDFDLDSDGKPDVWLDTASIYPKNYTITEEEVYWANPWVHLKTGDAKVVYEDIDHDGLTAQDTDNDGIVDIEEPGDKIRVWKVVWDIGTVDGYDYFDPYCSYELWIDPPDLVNLAAGVGYVHDKIDTPVDGMFYPYTPDIENADINNESWQHWMDKDSDNEVIWKNFVKQKMNNYEGFTFIDLAAENYELKPSDTNVGLVPQPHREFIAVVSLGGPEIDMTTPSPTTSLYSNIFYNSIFNEPLQTPIRTTYTYYAPLPNPLQFEYLTNSYTIKEIETGDTLSFLPSQGKADITFDILASTEYSYYWIRNAGHDVDYNDKSEAIEGIEELGDGVFGYFIYDLPKGIGGYSITLPKKEDGGYDIDAIVQVDGTVFSKWLDNPNTKNEVEIFEDPFQYHIYIPQLLIPPALDDDNYDGIDDWIDDRGDRHKSETGYLHDKFMLGNGEDYEAEEGWSSGTDNTYGDDKFEKLGRTNIKINVGFEGKGKEGPLEISKGGTLVVEEIFGGSPWVIRSHTLSAYAEGVDLQISSTANPMLLNYGRDTTFLKHVIEDINEPHQFNAHFSPYHLSYGYEDGTITTLTGGKDPCSLIEPAINFQGIIDFEYDNEELTLVPHADNSVAGLENYPRNVEGTFIEIKIEAVNASENNWLDAEITPVFATELGGSAVEMAYIAYPRPLVPDDNIGTFEAGWRFNKPEKEVLVKMGEIIPEIQPGRRAYWIFLIKLDETLGDGVYEIGFNFTTTSKYYDGSGEHELNYIVPPAKFSVSAKNSDGSVKEYQDFVIGQASLKDIASRCESSLVPLENSYLSLQDINHANYQTLSQPIASTYDPITGTEKIPLTTFDKFPTTDLNKIFVLEQAQLDSYKNAETFNAVKNIDLTYLYKDKKYTTSDTKVEVHTIGPKIIVEKNIKKLTAKTDKRLNVNADNGMYVKLNVNVFNIGTDIAQNTTVHFDAGEAYEFMPDSLPDFVVLNNNDDFAVASLGQLTPGQGKAFSMTLELIEQNQSYNSLITTLLESDVNYSGTITEGEFNYSDSKILQIDAYDFEVKHLQLTEYEQGKFTINAKVRNQGKEAEDILFTLYPVINGTNGAKIAETKILKFEKEQEIEIVSEFIVPDNVETVEIVAVVDGNEEVAELKELNNWLMQSIEIQTSLNQFESKNNISLYPKPCKDFVFLNYSLTKTYEHAEIDVFDLSGKLIFSDKTLSAVKGKHTFNLPIDKLQTGTYIVKFSLRNGADKEVFTDKLIKY